MTQTERPLYLVVGKSASGKDHFVDQACKRFSLSKVKSYTTRPPRTSDEDTHEFVTLNVFWRMQNMLVASSSFGPHWYGASQEQINEADFYIVDFDGAEQVYEHRDLLQRPLRLIVLVESFKTRITRLISRPDMDEDSLYKRLTADRQNFYPSALESICKLDWDKRYMLRWSGVSPKWSDTYPRGMTFEEYMGLFETAESDVAWYIANYTQ